MCRRNQKGKRHSHRKPRAGKPDEQRDGRTGAKGRDRSQQSTHRVRSDSVEPSHDGPAAFRRKIALNVRNKKNKHTEQDCNFDYIIYKKLQTAAQLPGDIHTS